MTKLYKFIISLFIIHYSLFIGEAKGGAYITGFARTSSDQYGMHDGITVPSLDRHSLFDRIGGVATIGYAFENGIRLEADFFSVDWNRKEAGRDQLGLDFGVGMTRLLYDVRLFDRFVPYFGLGVDMVGMRGNGFFDLGLVGGVTYKLSDKFALDLQYSRIYTNFFAELNGVGSHYRSWSNEVRTGIRYAF